MRLADGEIVHMGARPYALAHGRFLAVDPVEGGCAKDYAYAFGDPINESDLTGRSAGEFARCVLYETFGVALPGRSAHEAPDGEMTRRVDRSVGPSSQGFEVNNEKLAKFATLEVGVQMTSLPARNWARVLGWMKMVRFVPYVGLVVTAGQITGAGLLCRDRL